MEKINTLPATVRMSAVTHPLKVQPKHMDMPEGLTISQMLMVAQPDARQLRYAVVFIHGEIIPKENWPTYRPRAGALLEVRAFPIPRGGGGDGGKNPLRIVLTIAVLVAAMWAGPAAASFLGFAESTKAFAIASALATATVSIGGMLLVNAVAPIRPAKLSDLSSVQGQEDSPTLFIEGAQNALRPFSPVPVILGQYRMTPPYGSKPFTEVIGDKQFVRLLFIWGIGPVSIDLDTIKIGETLLSEFTGVQIEHREGYDDDEPLTLFPDTINQEDFSILLSQAAGWITRTSAADADELSVDLTFPQGLVQYDDAGGRLSRTVTVEIEYRLSGDSPWIKIDTSDSRFNTTAAASWLNKSGNDLTSITFNHNRTSAIRHGIRWGVDTRGQYEIRIRRTSADTDSSQIYDVAYWTALRGITNEDPVNSPVPVAKTALVIQATDQLNNIVDEFNAVITTVALDWDTGTQTWIERATQNPASLFRHVLQGNGSSDPLPDSRIDLEKLQDWHEFCETNGFKFNMVRDFSSSIWETLADVAAAGRAAPTQIDGKWSVVIEQEQENYASAITPRNSFDFKAEKFFITQPHGWRISFPNEDEDYRFDERRVYKDGYSDANATQFESLELPGVTDPEQIYKLGRFRLAQGILQPERWSWKQDMEFLTYQRGSKVSITHDILLVGLKSGRIKSTVLDGANVTGLVLDEEVTMEEGEDYGIAIRTVSNAHITAQVVTAAGTTKTLTLTTPIAGTGSPEEPAVVAGNLFGFGLLGQETDDASIISIVPDSDMRAQVIAVPYREAIFDVDSEEIPAFETNLTPQASIPAPTITDVVSDETALAMGAGESLRVRISISYIPLNQEIFGVEPELRVQIRPAGTSEPYINATIEGEEPNHFYITGIRTGETLDIRVRFHIQGRLPGPWAYIYSHLVVGKSTPPSPLVNMTISAIGSYALIRWDKPSELDVLFGGQVIFRHSPLTEGATWSASVSIGTAAMARTLFAVLPLKEGTYFARVFDVAGNPSETITSVTTKQANVLGFSNVDTIDEAPGWIGTHEDTIESGGDLKIDDSLSPQVLTGTYKFSEGIDMGSVKRVRLTTRITASTFNVNDYIDSRTTNIDTWEDFDGDLSALADAKVYVRHTDDDPAGSPVSWSSWERLESAEFETRAFEFLVILTRESEDYNILIDELGVDIEEVA